MPAYILRNVACDITRARAHGVYKEKPVKRYIHTSCVLLRSVGHATHMRRKGERERARSERRMRPRLGRVHHPVMCWTRVNRVTQMISRTRSQPRYCREPAFYPAHNRQAWRYISMFVVLRPATPDFHFRAGERWHSRLSITRRWNWIEYSLVRI